MSVDITHIENSVLNEFMTTCYANFTTYIQEVNDLFIKTQEVKTKPLKVCLANNPLETEASRSQILCVLTRNALQTIQKLCDVLAACKIFVKSCDHSHKFSDDENFDKIVQTSLVKTLGKAENKCLVLCNKIMDYQEMRGKHISKYIKHPRVEDYKYCVEEFDKNQILNLQTVLSQIGCIYIRLHHALQKNASYINTLSHKNEELMQIEDADKPTTSSLTYF